MNRFFRVADSSLYERLRLELDAAFGHEPPTTCVDPAAVAPRAADGSVVLSVRQEFCEFDAVAVLLPGLLTQGIVEEIDEATYRESLPQRFP